MAEETKTTPAAGAEQTEQAGQTQPEQKAPEGGAAGSESQTEEKQFTQADIDSAVEKRLARERRKWEREQTVPPAGGTAPAAGEKPKAEADDSAARIAKANGRQLHTEAKLAAIALGVPASRADYAARLADLSGVDVDDEDGPDAAAVKKAVSKVLEDIPELKPAAQEPGKAPGIKIGADNSPAKPAAGAPAAGTRIKPWNKFRT